MKLLKLFAVMIVAVLLCVPASAMTEEEWFEQPYYRIYLSIYENMPRNEGGIVFLGDSLTNYVQFSELIPGKQTHNRGIAGDTTLGVLNRLDEVISLKPSKLFILIGTNDIVYNINPETIAANIREIIRRVKENSPSTKIYIETLIPTNPSYETHRPNETINAVNEKIRAIAEDTGVELVDINSHMAENGVLPEKWTVDGIHLNGAGVVRWVEFLKGIM